MRVEAPNSDFLVDVSLRKENAATERGRGHGARFLGLHRLISLGFSSGSAIIRNKAYQFVLMPEL